MPTDKVLLDIEKLSTFLVPDELAGLMRTTIGALAQDRYLGRGVPFIKNGKRILYARADVVDFIKRNRRGEAGIDEPDHFVVERHSAHPAANSRTGKPVNAVGSARSKESS